MVLNLPYLLLLLPASLAWYAQLRVRAAYERYGRVANSRGILGADVAEALLAHLGLRQRVSIYLTPGYLNDHYDTRDKALYLTEGIAASRSVTAMGIVAHEVLHAQQDAEGYPLMRLRSWLGERLGNLPRAASWAILVGLLFHWTLPVVIGGVALLGTMLLVLTALPVERNASARALATLQETGLATAADLEGAQSVLRSAALTYVAGLVQYLGRLAFFGMLILVALGY